MSKTYNGWTNWETWNFMLHEGEQIEYAIQIGMDLKEVTDVVFTHISILAENEAMENISDIAREFATKGFDAVNIEEVAEAIYDNLKESHELV